jgi:transposase-like protein
VLLEDKIMAKSFNVLKFFEQFPDNDACLEHLMKTRYGNPLDCPKCGRHSTFSRHSKRPVYQCQWCSHQISPMAGTPFERSSTPLVKWFYAMYLFTTSRHGVPAKELQRQLGVTYKTAGRIGHEIRKYMGKVDGDDGLSGHVEVDETYMGGKRHGSFGRGTKGKTIILGMLERGGDVLNRIVPDVKRMTLFPHILEHVEEGSTISTDENRSYHALPVYGYQHGKVTHSEKEYARGIHHVNSLEGFWSRLKNSIKGTHVHVSRKHLDKYLVEFEYRYNMRANPSLMFDRLLASF